MPPVITLAGPYRAKTDHYHQWPPSKHMFPTHTSEHHGKTTRLHDGNHITIIWLSSKMAYFLAMFNTLFPLPHQASWTIFHLSPAICTKAT